MEESKPKSNTLSYLIIILLVISIALLMLNLGATIFLVLRSQQTLTTSSASANEPLPAELSSALGRTTLSEKFKEPFNNKDSDRLYALLDPLAQIEVTRTQFEQQMPLIYNIAGKIESGVYSHYEYMGISRGKKVFNLYYEGWTSQD